MWGRAPADASGWPIAVEDVRNGRQAALLGLAAGAVATSTVLRRCWQVGERRAHHLIDPATGRPADGELVAVTVVAGEATGAEVLAKAALIAGTIAGGRGSCSRRRRSRGCCSPLTARRRPSAGSSGLCWTMAEAA